jgi:hypothetical protein
VAPLNASNRRRSLLDKVSGPNAIAIAALVARGEIASRQVQKTFYDFLKRRVDELEAMQGALTGRDASESAWNHFYTLVHDIRGSSALAGNSPAHAFCVSLERLLLQCDRSDGRMGAAIASHIEALNLVMSRGTLDQGEQALVTTELSRAIDCLPPRGGI